MQIYCPKPEPRLASRSPPAPASGEHSADGPGWSDPRQSVGQRQYLQQPPEKPVPGSIGVSRWLGSDALRLEPHSAP